MIKDIKNIIVYQFLNDNAPTRTIDDKIQIIRDTNAQLVFRGNFWWNPISDTEYNSIKNTVSSIKSKSPDTILIAAVPAMRLVPNGETDEITKEFYDANTVWNIALDLAKWGILKPTKKEMQDSWNTRQWGWLSDLTNPLFQKLLIHRCQKFINAGYDGIWLDLFNKQSEYIYELTKNSNHQGVIDHIKAQNYIVSEIKKLRTLQGKIPYVGTWIPNYEDIPYITNFDFLTHAPYSGETIDRAFQDVKWSKLRKICNSKYPDALKFVFIDDGSIFGQLEIFAQKGGRTQLQRWKWQMDYLWKMMQYFYPKGFRIAFPIHGMHINSFGGIEALAFGKWNLYDAEAPEFLTYDKIVRFMQPDMDIPEDYDTPSLNNMVLIVGLVVLLVLFN